MIGSDSMLSSDISVESENEPKYFLKPVKCDEDCVDGKDTQILFGSAGETLVPDFLEFAFTMPVYHPDEDPMSYLMGSFIPALRISLESNQYKEQAKDNKGNLAIVFRDQMFILYANWILQKVHRKYISIGSGKLTASGVLEDTENVKNGKSRIRRAIRASAKILPSVDDKIYLHEVNRSDFL